MTTINPLSALSNLGETSTSKDTIANDFDTFLKLLTTQLQNQNPLEPLDTNQFTQQLVQFSEVEQTIKSNKNLENLIKLQAATAITNTVGYIGKTVEVAGITQPLEDNKASWPINAESDAENTSFTIKDAEGNVIFNETKATAAGASNYEWNGENNDGGIAKEGNYTLTVSATDTNGVGVNVDVASSGVVEGIEMQGNNIFLIVGGKEINLENITAVRQ